MSKRSSLQDGTREILISEVQTRPCLWNDTHPQFKNCEKNVKLWEEIGKMVDMKGKDAKNKWKNLKDKFRRELQKAPTGRSGDAGVEFKSKWPFFTSMMFVKDSIIPSKMSGNLIVGDELRSLSDATNDNESDIDIMSSSYIDVLSPSTSTYSKPKKNNKKRRIADDSTQQLLDIEKKKIAILQKAQENENKTQNDPDAQFLLSFLPYIKELNSLEKLEVRSQIQSVVINAYKKKCHESTQLVQQPYEANKDLRQTYNQTQAGPSNESEIRHIYRPYNEEINFSTSTTPPVSEPWIPYSSMTQSNHGSTIDLFNLDQPKF